MLKENKGMTLVALVIAIVVLLALAATVVYLVFGRNGVAAESPIVQGVQDRNYAESMVTVGLKAVRNEARTSTIDNTTTEATSTVTQTTDKDKMDLLIYLLEDSDFSRESDTVLNYTSNGKTYKITVNFDNYTITKVE